MTACVSQPPVQEIVRPKNFSPRFREKAIRAFLALGRPSLGARPDLPGVGFLALVGQPFSCLFHMFFGMVGGFPGAALLAFLGRPWSSWGSLPDLSGVAFLAFLGRPSSS